MSMSGSSKLASSTITLLLVDASAKARFTVKVVLPVPPLAPAIAIT